MATEYDYDDYRRRRFDRDYDEPYYQGQGGGYEESYYRGQGGEQPRYSYGGERQRYGYGGEQRYGYGRSGSYNEPYRRGYGGRSYSEPYGSYDYGRSEYGDRTQEPYYQRGHEGGYRERYRGGYGRGGEDRGFFERAGDEIKSWFGDEEAERRRRADEIRKGIYAGRGPRGYQRSDERIREDINDRLTDDWYIDASDVEVSVNNSMVTFTGRVNSREEKRRAEDIAECVSGVTDISNQLRVGRSVPITSDQETPRARSART
jgi:osmotically-inducible protein OsmY